MMKTKWKIILILSLIGNASIFYVAIKALEYRAHINEYLIKYINIVNDLSERDHYAENNLQFRADSTIDNRIIFFGTQTIERWDLDRYFPGFEAINRGVARQRAAGMLLRIYPDLIDLKPEWAVIEISSYNFRDYSSTDEIKDFWKSMMSLCQAEGIKPIGCTIIPPIPDSVTSREFYIKDTIYMFNEWIRSECDNRGWPLADFGTILADSAGYLRPDYAAAGIDPNDAGFRIMSETILKIIR